MPSTPPPLRPAPPTPPRPGSRIVRRELQTLGVGVLVAGFLSIAFRQSFPTTLVYSECIALSCWAFIDGGRELAARWVHRASAGQPTEPDGKASWPGWPWMLFCVLFGTLAGATTGNAIGAWLLGAETFHDHGSLRGLLTLLMVSLVPGIGITYFFWSRGHLQALQARTETAQRQAAENQLRLLESQLEPHMLFNTLANLRVLIGLDPPRAQEMLDRLIGFLRATLSASRVNQHPLALEFARVADYLALMKVRMGDRLRDELVLPDALAQHPVPPLLLQPLVENAIKHGLEPHVEGGRLQVSAALEGGQLVLRVRDTGAGLAAPSTVGDPAAGTGFGLEQVRERLATLYGAAASFELRAAEPSDAEGGTLAIVRLPCSPSEPTVEATSPRP